MTRLSRLNAQQNHFKGLLKLSAGLHLKRALEVCISQKCSVILVLLACRGHTLWEPKMQRGVESITFCRYRTWVPQRHSGTGRTLFSSPITDRHRAGAQRQWDVCWTEYQCCIVWFPCQPICKNNKKKKSLNIPFWTFTHFLKEWTLPHLHLFLVLILPWFTASWGQRDGN